MASTTNFNTIVFFSDLKQFNEQIITINNTNNFNGSFPIKSNTFAYVTAYLEGYVFHPFSKSSYPPTVYLVNSSSLKTFESLKVRIASNQELKSIRTLIKSEAGYFPSVITEKANLILEKQLEDLNQ